MRCPGPAETPVVLSSARMTFGGDTSQFVGKLQLNGFTATNCSLHAHHKLDKMPARIIDQAVTIRVFLRCKHYHLVVCII
jgi:hypothetical protein